MELQLHGPQKLPRVLVVMSSMSFTFAVLSSDAVIRLQPSCEKLTARTVPVWAFNMVERPSLQRASKEGSGHLNRHVRVPSLHAAQDLRNWRP